MRIEYRTIEGKLITYIIEDEITIDDINNITLQYTEKTYRQPEKIFIDAEAYSQLVKRIETENGGMWRSPNLGLNVLTLHLSIGTFTITPIGSSYIPILVGTQVEFEDNNMNKIFEEVVLKDCEREE